MKSDEKRESMDNLKAVVETIVHFLEKTEPIKNKNLIEICRANGVDFITGANEVHLIHELLETAVNQIIVRNFNWSNPFQKGCENQTLERLTNLLKNCPPQSWRGKEQISLQQFSTPPEVAYLLAKILNPSENELILEPSAGTGSLAAWLKVAGCRFHLNELSATRRMLLELQDYEPTGINAEFLDDLLPEEIAPDGVLMNPPFTASGGRTKNNDSNFGFRHVKSALARLKKGGRLVALLGSDTLTKTDKGLRFLSEIAAEYDLKAIINLPKNAFYKYGATLPTTIICIKKNEPKMPANRAKSSVSVLEISCRNLEEGLRYAGIFD